MNFIPRKFENIKDRKQYSFDDIVNQNNITIILGEPASGKTHQLDYYAKENINSTFICLVGIDEEEAIANDIQIVLIDSIDEALTYFKQEKILKSKLHKFIINCKKNNPNIKFVISCRYLEWNKIFKDDLKTIDESFNEYNIVDLEKNDINTILTHKGISKEEFWTFIEKNFLDELLKNILMTINIIQNFQEYKKHKISYIDIYEKIVKNHLAVKTDNTRSKAISTIPPEEVFLIVASLATYMTLNKINSLDTTNIDLVVDELYKIDGLLINGDRLNIILDTSLFVGQSERVSFSHRSIQEYLCACFINEMNLSFEAIQSLFAYQYRFYEEFEEVIIYLTNLESRYFKYIVNFDPFIFRRHPYLTQDQQKLLLTSMLDILKKARQKAWGKWEYIFESSLVHLPEIVNHAEIIQNQIDITSINDEEFTYVMSIFKHNYSTELENLVFDILDNLKSEKDKCLNFINRNKINNIDYNQRLFDFIIENNLIDPQVDHLYTHIFKVLYKKRHFKELSVLLRNFSIYTDKQDILNIEVSDLEWWLCTIRLEYKKHKRNHRIKPFNDEKLSIILYALLQKNKDKTDFYKIVQFIDEFHIHIDLHTSSFDKEDYNLCFNDIKDNFCKFYFAVNKIDTHMLYSAIDLLTFYKIDVSTIEDMALTYPIAKFKEHYSNFRGKVNNVDDVLMKDNEFKDYMEAIWAKQAEYRRKRKRDNLAFRLKELQRKKQYWKFINSLNTYTDACNIFLYIIHDLRKHDNEEIHTRLINDLGKTKHNKFLALIKSNFQTNQFYLKLKQEVPSSTYESCPTMIYSYLFATISEDELFNIIQTSSDYEKLFWYTYRSKSFSENYFSELTKAYLNEFKKLYIDLINTSLSNSKGIKSGITHYFQNIFQELDIYDSNNLSVEINQLKKIFTSNYATLREEDKETLLDVIALDKNNYQYLKTLMLKDTNSSSKYMTLLLSIDLNTAIDDYLYNFYPHGDEKLIFMVENHQSNLFPVYKPHHYDNLKIKPSFISAFKRLIRLLYNRYDHRYTKRIEDLNDEQIKFFLKKYFYFFKPYQHPTGSYSPDEYDNMNQLINNIFNFLGEDSKYINLLESMKTTNNQSLKPSIERALERSYNQQLTEGSFPSSHYKLLIKKYLTEEKSQRFFDYDKLRDDLITLGSMLTESRKAIFQESEDETNDRFRDLLKASEYHVLDQSRGGESGSGKSVGERDLIIIDEYSKITESVIEAFVLTYLDTTNIDKHFDKLIKKYDTVGNKRNFILIYSKAKDYKGLWEKYKKHFDHFVEMDHSQKENVKSGLSLVDTMEVYHIFINFYSDTI